ncbi:hypothetical protein ACHAWF_012688 [Thalassiosira exigua]
MANGVPQHLKELLESTAPGDVITLQQPPDISNVELFPDISGDDEKTRRKNKENIRALIDQISIDDGTDIVPIEISNKKSIISPLSQDSVSQYINHRGGPSQRLYYLVWNIHFISCVCHRKAFMLHCRGFTTRMTSNFYFVSMIGDPWNIMLI